MRNDEWAEQLWEEAAGWFDAAAGGGHPELREALNLSRGTIPAGPGAEWPGSLARHQRQWPRYLGRALARVDVWILIAGIAGVVIAYLTLVQPR